MLSQIRSAIRETAPTAKERISYGMAFYEYRFTGFKGRLAYFGVFRHHVSFQPLPHRVPAALEAKLESYRAAKSTLRFPIASDIPVELIRQLVRLRKAEIDGVP